MFGLIAFAIVIAWSMMAIFFSKQIQLSRRLGTNPYIAKFVRFILFMAILIFPISDELIGRLQFHWLCARNAAVVLSPDWKEVKRAKRVDLPTQYPSGYVIEVREHDVAYVDIDTKRSFLEYKIFSTSGGFLMHRLGLGLSTSISCFPINNVIEVDKQIKLDELVKEGDKK